MKELFGVLAGFIAIGWGLLVALFALFIFVGIGTYWWIILPAAALMWWASHMDKKNKAAKVAAQKKNAFRSKVSA